MSISPPLFIRVIVIALVIVFVADVQAETSICPPLQDCPPVLACKEGYSCQPNEPPPPPSGEKQKYPPTPGETWVNTIVPISTLTDVAINDPRWGGREEGEVYARENNDFIVWYWPDGGQATFDTTSLGSMHSWFDFTYSTDISNSGGPMASDKNKKIKFSNSLGISIFKRVSHIPVDPPVYGFLDNYTNPAQNKVPADGMYPFGQRMWMSMYANKKSELNRMKSAGMTLSGPHYHGCSDNDPPPNIVETDEYGMKMFWRLYVGSGSWGSILDKMKSAKGRDSLTARVKRCINVVLGDPIKNRVVVAWYGHEEEPIHRSSTPLDAQRDYLKLVRDTIAAADPKKRPYFVSERSDSNYSTMVGNAEYTSGIMKQNYLMRVNNYDYSGKEMDERFLIGKWVQDELRAAKAQDDKGLSYTGKIRPVIATLSMYVDPEDKSLRNETWLRKAIKHDFWLSIAMGTHGVNTYTWTTSSSVSTTTKDLQEHLYLEIMGQFSNAGLGKVFLWGDERYDVTLKIISGPSTFTWNKYRDEYTEPSIKFRNIQYGNSRYILLVNSAKQAVTIKLSGIPTDLNITDMIKGGTGSTTTTIQPLDVRMYKVSK